MKCSKCGRDNPTESKYCNECGQLLTQPTSVSRIPPVNVPEAAEQAKTTQAEKFVAKEKAKKRQIAVICGVWTIVLIALLALLLSRCSTGEGTEGSSEALKPQTDFSEWSLWVDELPEGISEDQYQIETQKLYRSRTKETTSASQDTLEGWELYETANGNGDYGPWSDWTQNAVNSTEMRQVETQTQYRYSEKETTTDNSPTKSGWELYDTTYEWSNWGNWSDWSSNTVSGSDSRQIETKTQYRYCDKETTSSSSSSMSGWTMYDWATTYGSWGSWSSWSNNYVSENEGRQVETRYIDPTYTTQYNYSRYNEYDYSTAGRRGWNGPTMGYWGGHYCQYYEERGWSTDRLSYAWSDSGYSVYGTSGNYWYNETSRQVESSAGYTQYRYRERSVLTTYYFYRWGSWSDWSDTSYSSSSNRDVETRTVYRYRDRSQIPTYHFFRWNDWSAWSENPVSQTDTRKVETATFYRYRDRVKETTYYFSRWTDWSDWSTDIVTASDPLEVEEKEQYRYKQK